MAKQAISKELMAEFAHLLATHMGLHYPQEQWHDLEKKLLRVMIEFGFQDLESCLRWLKRNPLNKEQITLLAQHLTIGETYFFRDSRTFTALKEKIFPHILKSHQQDRHVRIWSAGCCTGEEPYSIAILLHQMISNWKNWNIEILGTDINSEFLRKAEHGNYRSWSFRTTPSEIIKKYFTQHEGFYSVIPEIKKSVKFSYLNLVEDTYPEIKSNTPDIDLILCHNVLIYFSHNQIQKIVNRLTNALKEHAWLSVSAIEAPFVSDKHLVLQNFSGAFFFKKESKKRAIKSDIEPSLSPAKEEILLKMVLPAFLQSSSSLDIHLPKEEKKISQHEEKDLYEKCLHLSQSKHYEEAISKLLAYLLPYQKDEKFIYQHSKEIILLIHIYANQGALTQALEWIEIALKSDKLNPILYYLQATILNFLDDIPNGIKSLKRALFLDSNLVAAYYMLGILEQKQQNHKAALRSFRTALELLQNYGAEEILPGTEDLTAGYLKDFLLTILEKYHV